MEDRTYIKRFGREPATVGELDGGYNVRLPLQAVIPASNPAKAFACVVAG